MRPSEFATLAQCEALWLRRVPEGGAMSAAAYVGKLAHALLTGVHDGPQPQVVAWDKVTKNESEAQVQRHDIAEQAMRLLEDHGWAITAAEVECGRDDGELPVSGRCDLIVEDPVGRNAVVDLKTGQQVGGAWLQVGAYLLDPDFAGYDGGILHVPRSRSVDRMVERSRFEVRSGTDLMLMANWEHRRAKQVVESDMPRRTPGSHCEGCPITDCPVRP